MLNISKHSAAFLLKMLSFVIFPCAGDAFIVIDLAKRKRGLPHGKPSLKKLITNHMIFFHALYAVV